MQKLDNVLLYLEKDGILLYNGKDELVHNYRNVTDETTEESLVVLLKILDYCNIKYIIKR